MVFGRGRALGRGGAGGGGAEEAWPTHESLLAAAVDSAASADRP